MKTLTVHLNEAYAVYQARRTARTQYEWVLKPVIRYSTKEVLLANFQSVVLDRAWKKHLELRRQKSEALEVLSIEEMSKRLP